MWRAFLALTAPAVMALGLATSAVAAPATAQVKQDMQFLAARANEVGTIPYVVHIRDTSDGARWDSSMSDSQSKAVPYPDQCILSYDWRTVVDGKVDQDDHMGIPFAEVVEIRVLSAADDTQRLNNEAGHPTWKVTITPSFWVVNFIRADGTSNTLDFRDRSAAEQAAAAGRRLAQACGGSRLTAPRTQAPKSPASPKVGDGLAETLQFIADRVGAQGRFYYRGHSVDTKTGEEFDTRFQVEASDVRVDVARCAIVFRWRTAVDDASEQDTDSAIPFGKITDVEVITMSEDNNRAYAEEGRSEREQITPEIWVVGLSGPEGRGVLDFHTRADAEAVAKAALKASQMCRR